MIKKYNFTSQTENRSNTTEESSTSNNANKPAQVNDSQVNMHTFEKRFVIKELGEVDILVKVVETEVLDAILSSTQSLVSDRVEPAIKSDLYCAVPDPDQRHFSRNIERLQMTASKKYFRTQTKTALM